MKTKQKENPLSLFTWVSIPAGKFTMGSPESEEGRWNDENQVEVEITKPFEMMETQVTQLQYTTIAGRNPSTYEGIQKPVQNVSWQDATDFCNFLSTVIDSEYTYRLPTEAEWEYACRAGTATKYSCQTDRLEEYATFDLNDGPENVKTGQANPWGLYDMHGNVWEWCSDWYSEKLEGGKDPKGPKTGSHRVIRGGSWDNPAQLLRSAKRDYGHPDPSCGNVGFRLVRVRTNTLDTITLLPQSETREAKVEAILKSLDQIKKQVEELK